MNNRRELLRCCEEGKRSTVSRSDAWIDQELVACEIRDVRLGKRFRILLQQFASGVGGSIPWVCQDWANTKAAYRFFSNDRVSEADIPIQAEKNEPVFHEPWQGRAFAVTRAMGAWRKWNLDAVRYQREQVAPVDYFRMSYYERWIVALVQLMLKNGTVTPADLESGKPDRDQPNRTRRSQLRKCQF
jgi:hypothetical protein